MDELRAALVGWVSLTSELTLSTSQEWRTTKLRSGTAKTTDMTVRPGAYPTTLPPQAGSGTHAVLSQKVRRGRRGRERTTVFAVVSLASRVPKLREVKRVSCRAEYTCNNPLGPKCPRLSESRLLPENTRLPGGLAGESAVIRRLAAAWPGLHHGREEPDQPVFPSLRRESHQE
jgi:hypothetical protein